jgi:hypothetical protein
LYYILKQKRIRKHYSERWQPVALYDLDGYFRGQAIFQNLDDARYYKKRYTERINLKNYSNKIFLKLRIFREAYIA